MPVFLTALYDGPLVYNGEIYVSSDLYTFADENHSEPTDYARRNPMELFTPYRNFSRELQILSEIIENTEDPENRLIKLQDEGYLRYAKASFLEENGDVDLVVNISEKFQISECQHRSYSLEEIHEYGVSAGYELQQFEIAKEDVLYLRETFGAALPREEDFDRTNAIFMLQAQTTNQLLLSQNTDFSMNPVPGVCEVSPSMVANYDFYVGVIFYEDGNLYYGNYDNEITGEVKERIIEGIENIPN